MKLVCEKDRLKVRSTGALSARQMAGIIGMLESSAVIFRYDMGRRRDAGRRLKFGTVQMATILLFMEAKKLTFEGLREMAGKRGGQVVLKNLGMPVGPDGRYVLPSDGWLSEFRNHAYPEIRAELEAEIRRAVMERYEGVPKVITVDSTPLEASRYSEWADFNPHYRIRMGKAHIVMVNGVPIASVITNGNAGDNPGLLRLLGCFDGTRLRDARFLSDGGYASHESYLGVFRATGLVMSSNTGSNGRIHADAEWRNVVRRYNRLSRFEGFVPAKRATPGFVLRFLAAHGEAELAGWALRNLDIHRPEAVRAADAKARHVCETVHRAMKRWVDLDVRGLWRRYAGVRCCFRILVCTLLCLAFRAYDC